MLINIFFFIQDNENRITSMRKGQITEKNLKHREIAGKSLEKFSINNFDNEFFKKIFMHLSLFDRLEMKKGKMNNFKEIQPIISFFFTSKYFFPVCKRWRDASRATWDNIKKFKCSVLLGRSYNNRLMRQSDVVVILRHCGENLTELITSGNTRYFYCT